MHNLCHPELKSPIMEVSLLRGTGSNSLRPFPHNLLYFKLLPQTSQAQRKTALQTNPWQRQFSAKNFRHCPDYFSIATGVDIKNVKLNNEEKKQNVLQDVDALAVLATYFWHFCSRTKKLI